MLIDVKKVDATKRELKIEIPKDRVKKKLDEVYEELGKHAQIKGFRQGKVPRQVLEQHHGKTAHDEVVRKLIPEVYHEALHKENLSPIDMPEIEDVHYQDGIIKFTAKLDIKPDIKVGNYKGIKVKRQSSQVSDEELNKTLEYFKQGQAQGKEAVMDDAFARGMGYPSLDEFKKALARQMELDKDRHNRLDVENQVVEHLLKSTKVVVPQSLAKRQYEHRLGELRDRLKNQGVSAEDIKKKEEELKGQLEKNVERDICAYLIFEKIAQLENIETKENDNLPAKVMEFLLKEAKWSNEEK